jgi:hypothetical protein
VTTATQIGLTWAEGPYNGGSPIIDYQVSYREVSSSDYIVFTSVFTSTSGTITGLTAGLSYDFVVKSRNIIKLSDYSLEIAVKAAQIPDAPVSL